MNNLSTKTVHLSIVSHGQSRLIAHLLEDIERYCRGAPLHVTVTLNIPESLCFDPNRFKFPLRILHNTYPRGFAANHNAAFHYGQREHPCDYISIVNPDIRLSSNPLPGLLDCLEDDSVGVVAPLVLNPEGEIEDNARRFPTPWRILAKTFRRARHLDYVIDRLVVTPDWVAGMFMLIPAEAFHRVGGFDERYFLYYEDVDFCARLRLAGYGVRLCPAARVVHASHRQSHRDWRYFRWHVKSALRFFTSKAYFDIAWRRLTGSGWSA